MKTIEVFTFLTSNSADYAELLRGSMEKLKSGKNTILYRCIESVGCERLPRGWDCVASVKNNLGHNCLNHANAIHEAIKNVKYSHVLFVDADMCILHKDWDTILCNELYKCKIWGTAFGDNSIQYNKFPNVFFFAFKSDILKMVALDFNPKLQDGQESPVRSKIKDARDARYFNKNIGDVIKCDTGWRLPLIAGRYSIKHSYMPRVLGNEKGSQLPYADNNQKVFCLQKPDHMAEWHYNGKIYCTHKQASRNHPLNGEWGSVWKNRIDLYLNKEHGIV